MNLPNKLSLIRIILVPVMAVCYVVVPAPWSAVSAIAVFVIAAFTDFLDGYIARKYNLITDLGKLLDPIADKLLVTLALLLVIEDAILPVGIGSICGGIIIGRELLISVVRQVAASKGVVLQANKYGKLKTVFQDISLPVLMLLSIAKPTDLWLAIEIAAYVLFGIAVLMTILSGAIYIVQNRKVFSEKKE